MNISKYRFTLDLQSDISQISIPVRVHDSSRRLYISFTDGGSPVSLPDGSVVVMSIKRPTETSVQSFCTIEQKSVAVYEFNENTAIVAGVHSCDVTIYDSSNLLVASPKFTMVVSEKAVEDPVVSDENFTMLQSIITQEAERQKNENERTAKFNEWSTNIAKAISDANSAAEKANNASDGKDGVSPTVKVESISGGHKVTITDKDGDKSFTVMNGATVNDVIAALPKYNGEVVDV